MDRSASKGVLWYFSVSLLTHATIFLVLLASSYRKYQQSLDPRVAIRVDVVQSSPASGSRAKSLHAATAVSRRHSLIPGASTHSGFSLVPKWSAGLLEKGGSESIDEKTQESRQFSRDFLETESKVGDAFDALAGRIHRHLDCPDLLSDNGIQGAAAIDLFFDSSGNVDEVKSHVSGDHRLLRGLLVRATRKGLLEWLQNDARRLRSEQYRNQHFRADFIITYSQVERPPLLKLSPGSYELAKKRVSNVSCLGNFGGSPGLDVSCVAMSVGGAIHRGFSDRYKIQLMAVKDSLEYQDELGLRGINLLARANL